MPIGRSLTIPARTRSWSAPGRALSVSVRNFPMGNMQGFLGLRGYGEFDTANRAHGWNTWLTFAISPAEPAAITPTRHLVAK
jgi:hypothetical protein